MSIFAGRNPARWAWLLTSLLGCSSPDGEANGGAPAPASAQSVDGPLAQAGPPCASSDAACAANAYAAASASATCDLKIPILHNGERVGAVCPAQAPGLGLTAIELGERWAPRVLDGNAELGPTEYQDRYLRIAREDYGVDPSWDRERRDLYFELYGIFPTFSRLMIRLGDNERHSCHAALDDAGLAALGEPIDTWRSRDKQRADRLEARRLKTRIEAAAGARRAGVDSLEGDPRWGPVLATQRRLVNRERAIRDMQNHLRCERLLGPKAEAGILDGATIEAMYTYFRRHMIVSWQLDRDAAEVLVTDSRELDYRQTLRALRARVIDATGLIEDGSASGRRGAILGRAIDTPVFTKTAGPALPDAAGDLVSRATTEVAEALGWTSPEETARRLAAGLPDVVLVRLSPRPAYHSEHMDLRVMIDRGDVVYDSPSRRARPGTELARRERSPSLVLYARHDDQDIALVRWPTTIGGWQPEAVGGSNRVMLVYKESPAGERIWRDVVAAPRWIPPSTTPERDLVRPSPSGGWAPKLDTFGPSYASAYGLVMMIHNWEVGGRLADNGIRTHGSASYGSIFDGYSHGCHRLHNHRAIDLSGFLLAHRHHAVRGPIPVGYVRQFQWQGRPMRLDFASRGFRYELDPPIQVDVTEGRVRGHAGKPLPPEPLPRHLVSRYGYD